MSSTDIKIFTVPLAKESPMTMPRVSVRRQYDGMNTERHEDWAIIPKLVIDYTLCILWMLLSGVYATESSTCVHPETLYKNIHSSAIYNSLKLKKISNIYLCRVEKQTVLYLCSGILHSSEKKWTTTCR